MKNYNQMANDALRRIKEQKELQRRKNKIMKLTLVPALALCLAAVLGIGIWQNNNTGPIILNETSNITSADMDVKIKDCKNQPDREWNLSLKEFQDFTGFRYEEFTTRVPGTWKIIDFYSISARNYKDTDSKDNYYLHDYVFTWQTPNDGEVKIALCPFEAPLRDCIFICDNPKQSEINGTSLIIYGDNSTGFYTTQFTHQNMNYDIEAKNITLAEFAELLSSILSNSAPAASN